MFFNLSKDFLVFVQNMFFLPDSPRCCLRWPWKMLGNDGAPGGGEASVCQKGLSKTFVWWKMTTSLAKILLSLFSIWGNYLKNFQDVSEHRVVSVRKKPFLEVSLRQDGSKRIWWPFHRSHKPSSAQAAKVEETALRTTFCPAAPDSHGILFSFGKWNSWPQPECEGLLAKSSWVFQGFHWIMVSSKHFLAPVLRFLNHKEIPESSLEDTLGYIPWLGTPSCLANLMSLLWCSWHAPSYNRTPQTKVSSFVAEALDGSLFGCTAPVASLPRSLARSLSPSLSPLSFSRCAFGSVSPTTFCFWLSLPGFPGDSWHGAARVSWGFGLRGARTLRALVRSEVPFCVCPNFPLLHCLRLNFVFFLLSVLLLFFFFSLSLSFSRFFRSFFLSCNFGLCCWSKGLSVKSCQKILKWDGVQKAKQFGESNRRKLQTTLRTDGWKLDGFVGDILLGRYPERKHASIYGKMEKTSVSLMGYFSWIPVWRSKMASRVLSPWEKQYCIFESVLTCFNMAVCLGFVLWLFLWVRGYAIWLALSMASDSIFQRLWQKRRKSAEKWGKGRKGNRKKLEMPCLQSYQSWDAVTVSAKLSKLRCRDGVCKVIKVEMPWRCLQSYQSWDAVTVSAKLSKLRCRDGVC